MIEVTVDTDSWRLECRASWTGNDWSLSACFATYTHAHRAAVVMSGRLASAEYRIVSPAGEVADRYRRGVRITDGSSLQSVRESAEKDPYIAFNEDRRRGRGPYRRKDAA
jgi:hypothetical protein